MLCVRPLWGLAASGVCVLLLLLLLHGDLLREGQLSAGSCEVVTLDRDSSQPRTTIARQTARCACRRGQIAGTTRAQPACVDVRIVRARQWCDMSPCLDHEGCGLLINNSGWTCTRPGGRVKTTTSPSRRSVPVLPVDVVPILFLKPAPAPAEYTRLVYFCNSERVTRVKDRTRGGGADILTGDHPLPRTQRRSEVAPRDRDRAETGQRRSQGERPEMEQTQVQPMMNARRLRTEESCLDRHNPPCPH